MSEENKRTETWTVWRAGRREETEQKIETRAYSDPHQAINIYTGGDGFELDVPEEEEDNVFCLISPTGQRHVFVAAEPRCPLVEIESESECEEHEAEFAGQGEW